MRLVLLFVSAFWLSGSCFAAKQNPTAPLRLSVDLTEAPRNIFHASLIVPATPGEMTLVYPKWIPGNHRPSGPIANLTGLHFRAGDQEVPWQRDPVEMYSFHLTVPANAKEIEAHYDLISADSAGAGGQAASSNLLDLNWNQVVLYPDGAASDTVQVSASVRLPAGWKYATALTAAHTSGNEIEFASVSLTTLVDSPLIAGSHFREIELVPSGEIPVHYLDMVGESDVALDISPQDITAYRKLVMEADALFAAHHYTQYRFLYTLSDEVGHHGVEHHQSSDNSAAERTFTDPQKRMLEAGLLPHEFTHSWNGKYRRPAGLATPNYQEPMIGDLLWVYEGLTDYLGNVLTARSGLWTAEQYRDYLAFTAAMLDHRAGRTWRPLEDTAVSVQTLRMLGPQWENWRRSLDYYPEGDLIWLEVDSILRQKSEGRKSLDDFCRRFHGGESGPPKVVRYTFDDIVRELNAIVPYDWGKLLQDRVRKTSEHAPLGGIEGSGWRLVYTSKPNGFLSAIESVSKNLDFTSSLGLLIGKEGQLTDAIPGSPAYVAGLGPGMKLIAVNGRRWNAEIMKDALRAAQQNHQPIEFLAQTGDYFKAYSVPYFEGEKLPHLERIEGRPDLLTNILAAKTGQSSHGNGSAGILPAVARASRPRPN